MDWRRVAAAVARRLLILAGLLVLLGTGGAAAWLLVSAGGGAGPRPAAVAPATDTGLPGAEAAAEVLPVRGPGAQPAWLPDGSTLVCSRNRLGTQELYLLFADGDSRCLTLPDSTPAELRGRHKGNAQPLPSGTLLLFTAENRHGDHGPATLPQHGAAHDLWLMRLDGSMFVRLTESPAGVVLRKPAIAPDGRTVAWSRMVQPPQPGVTGRELGEWEVCVAALRVGWRGARLTGERVLLAPGTYAQAGGFSRDGRHLLVSMATESAPATGSDLYRVPLRRGAPAVRLTATPDSYDGAAVYAPDGRSIVWVSGDYTAGGSDGASDLYRMNANGDSVVRLTRYNAEAGADGAIATGAPAWHPSGDTITAWYRRRSGMLGWEMWICELPAVPRGN